MNFFKPKFWDKNEISFFSILLFPFALLIKLINFFKRSLTKPSKFSIPIICVGNIYLGGTGKTPLCMKIFIILKNLNMSPAFIRKKYEAFQDEVNLEKQIGPVYENTNRKKGIIESIQYKTNVAILDDGFQDFSIKKDLSIICFNEKQWLGNGFTIPSGPLRENLSAIKRADCIIINGKKNKDIEKIIFHKNEKIKIFYSKYKPQNTTKFQNKKVIAFAGIGNPENFFDLIKENKINAIETIKFSDHHKYSENELKNLLNKAKMNDTILLTTEKDYLRISENYKENINYLKIDMEIENENEFIKEIKKII